MDSYLRECHREFHIMSAPTVSIVTVLPCLPDRFQATFKVSCQRKYQNWIVRQDSTELEFLDEVQAPLFTKSILYNPEKTTDSKFKMQKKVFNGLKDFSMPSSFEGFELAKVLSDTAWDIIVQHMPEGGNDLNIEFSFALVHKHIFDENLAINQVIQHSMEEVLELALPATDASIKSLTSKVMDSSDENDHGSCRICLEDFETGFRGLAMPCSHIFHKDCIEKWLRASHYCPICRYQMPTD